MFGLGMTELIIILMVLLILASASRWPDLWERFKKGGPFDGPKSGFEFQPIISPGSVVSHCPKCGAATKGFYENCPICGEKIGERLAVAKTL